MFCGSELSPLRRLLNQHFCSKEHEIENTRQLNMAALSRLASAVVERKPLAHAADTSVNPERDRLPG